MHKPIVILAACLAACASFDDRDPALDEASAPLIEGTATSARPEIGQIATPNGRCTATLIGTRYVLTAAHCVGTAAGNDMTFWFVDKNGVSRPVATSQVHKLTREIAQDLLGDVLFSTDVALLQLVSPVPASQADPARVAMNKPSDGDQVTLFGYGCQSRDTGGGGGFKQFFSFRFRQPPSNNVCPGDSGGPDVYGGVNGGGAIWGVNSSYNGENDAFGDAAFFKPQIEDVIRTWDGELEVGMDRPGMTYATVSTKTAAGCRAACTYDARCRSFSYSFAVSGQCSLKEGVPDMRPAAGFTSGVAPTIEAAVDRPGMDYATFVPAQPRAESCATACAGDAQCRAWTYVEGGACWLKNGVPPAQPCTTCASGVLDRVYEPGYDRQGRDYASTSGSTPRACAAACARDARCRAFTWTGSPNLCRLKDAVPDPSLAQVRYRSSTASGVRRGLDVDVTRPGGDYLVYQQATPSPYECQAQCASQAACQAWEFRLPPDGDTTMPFCALKSSVPAAATTFGSISGLKGLELVP